MKYLVFILLVQAFFCFGKQYNIEFSPVNINYSGMKFNDDTLTVLGDFGTLLKGNPNTEDWKQIQVFENGRIVEIFEGKNRKIAFNDKGSIAISDNAGNDWQVIKKLDIELLAVISFPEGYLIRSRDKLLTLDKNFEITGFEYELFTKKPMQWITNLFYDNSIVFYDNRFVVGSDYENYLVLSKDLKLLKELDFKKIISDTSESQHFRIYTDSNFVYFRVDGFLYKTNDFNDIKKYTKTKIKGKDLTLIDGDFYSIGYRYLTQEYYYKYDFDLYKITPDTTTKVLNASSEINTNVVLPDYFTIHSGKLYIAGQNKHLSEISLKDSTVRILSDYSGFGRYGFQDKIKDSSYIFYSLKFLNEFYSNVYRTDNDGVTFKPITYKNTENNFSKFNFTLKYFDKKSNNIILGGFHYSLANNDEGIFQSNDYGKTFRFKSLAKFDLKNIVYPIYKLIYNYPELYKSGKNYISYNHKAIFGDYSQIFLFNENFDILETFNDSTMFVWHIHSGESSNYLFCGIDIENYTHRVKYSEDKGKNWKIIKEYKDSVELHLKKEIKVNDKKYLFMFFEDLKDSLVFCDAVDLDSKEIVSIFNRKKNDGFKKHSIPYSVTGDSDFVYIAVEDTLYRTNDLLDRESWEYIVFPNNGKVLRFMDKEDGRFMMRYSDSLRKDNIYWVKINNFIKPEAIIYATDHKFGKVQINKDLSKKAVINIENRSDNKKLIINDISLPKESVYSVSLTDLEDLYPIEIAPLDTFKFEVTFRPEEVREYVDTIAYYSNAVKVDNITYLRGKGIDTLTSVNENYAVDQDNYLYHYPPFPNPAKTHVRTKLIWDTWTEIKLNDVEIYNVYGEKVNTKDKLQLERLEAYSGYLYWNCTNVKNGVYIILIRHRAKTRTAKVMVYK